ncbi:MAG: endolytic transglycosylase MltG [Candidatus Magasanikbacteria bacterium]|jgi:UPF0755 protein|nr:endolytic transglycosylase MltG [Candidatus Magasanikbacteria bacterium]MBT4315103.1 endolytic transglycosylase MltG [Candidatus Magasanikbacteria bacterium]MBT4547013.1 endolytic transglycosylase MltG [Candidatus Magasanikbacteria bacterium]MBT6819063.1 endolytic transglycosylase MltG [Candidatus Magasanikbacteria bacterium]
MKKIFLIIISFFLLVATWFFISEIYTAEAQKIDKVTFEVKQGESVGELVIRLEDEQIIRHAGIFKRYLILKGMDKKVNYGEFEVGSPVTASRVAKALSQPGLSEESITIIPGWTIRDIAIYFSTQGGPVSGGENLGKFQQEEITDHVGLPAVNYKISGLQAPDIKLDLKILEDKPWYISYEGYLAPETYRVYKNADVAEIIQTLLEYRESQITDKMWDDIEKSGRSFFDILTMASILEQEVRVQKDKKIVADIFWRRYDMNWALQADSTVHYAVGKNGDVFTTAVDRDTNSPWNTYKYPGLPMGPISNPSLESIEAAIYPEKNDHWYFLTDLDGVVHYAEDLDGHNLNRQKYL